MAGREPAASCSCPGARRRPRQTLHLQAALDTIPAYVRAGTILPLGPVLQSTGADTIVVTVDTTGFPPGPMDNYVWVFVRGRYAPAVQLEMTVQLTPSPTPPGPSAAHRPGLHRQADAPHALLRVQLGTSVMVEGEAGGP